MIKFVSITEHKKDIRNVRELYKQAFPKKERPPFYILLKKAKKGKGSFCAVYDDDNFIGLTHIVEGAQAVYLGFFAVTENMRGKGYGTLILESLKAQYNGKPIMVLIEQLDAKAQNYAQRVRRKNFYLRCGFKATGVKIKDFGLVYDLLSYGGYADAALYVSVMKPFWGSFIFRLIYSEVK